MSPAALYIFILHKSFDILLDAYCGDHLMQGVSWRMCKDHALKGKTLVCRETGKMNRWSNEAANVWYEELPFLIGCNFLPSNASNQLEMFQSDSFDEAALRRVIGWARDLGFNTLRVYLHDLLVEEEGFFGQFETLPRHRCLRCCKT